MAADTPSQGGRRHFHRGRRGQSSRGGERRSQSQQPSPQTAEQPARGDQVDVEHIMRDIRSKISDRPGIELSDQQVQELAARRLESILDPRTIKPALLEQLRRAAGARSQNKAAPARIEPPYTFEDTTLFESPNPVVRFIRKLLAPILKLFFNPNPLIRALNIQARLNTESAKREAERDERQAEWNALHYELLQRVVSEIAKVSLEAQSLALRMESLSAKVDFNERRVRGLEGSMHQGRPPGGPRERVERDREPVPPPEPMRAPQPAAPQAIPEAVATTPEVSAAEGATSETPRRRRRRRRGRRGGGANEASPQGAAESAVAAGTLDPEGGDEDVEGDVAGESEFEAVSVSSLEQVDVTPEVTPEAPPEAALSFADTVTTEGERVEEAASPRAETEMAARPEPVPEPPPATPAPPQEPEQVHVPEPAATPDETTPERGRTDQ